MQNVSGPVGGSVQQQQPVVQHPGSSQPNSVRDSTSSPANPAATGMSNSPLPTTAAGQASGNNAVTASPPSDGSVVSPSPAAAAAAPSPAPAVSTSSSSGLGSTSMNHSGKLPAATMAPQHSRNSSLDPSSAAAPGQQQMMDRSGSPSPEPPPRSPKRLSTASASSANQGVGGRPSSGNLQAGHQGSSADRPMSAGSGAASGAGGKASMDTPPAMAPAAPVTAAGATANKNITIATTTPPVTPKAQTNGDISGSGSTGNGSTGAGAVARAKSKRAELEDTEEERLRKLRREAQEEKILVDEDNIAASSSGAAAGTAAGRADDDKPIMSATSYPGQEWNPYGAGYEEWE